jgi:hypothetical protein
VQLASRPALCVHEPVRALKTAGRINDACRELAQQRSKGTPCPVPAAGLS